MGKKTSPIPSLSFSWKRVALFESSHVLEIVYEPHIPFRHMRGYWELLPSGAAEKIRELVLNNYLHELLWIICWLYTQEELIIKFGERLVLLIEDCFWVKLFWSYFVRDSFEICSGFALVCKRSDGGLCFICPNTSIGHDFWCSNPPTDMK